MWSVGVTKLNRKKDQAYIINQILSYGTLPEIRWLMRAYGKQIVREVFFSQPMKIYTPSAFRFSQLLLDASGAKAYRYDQTLPRRIG